MSWNENTESFQVGLITASVKGKSFVLAVSCRKKKMVIELRKVQRVKCLSGICSSNSCSTGNPWV